ncbi:MAG TPA: acyl-CoA dehydrogenase family protein [Vicinamibacterales bacterium]|nr:acyl-CoA dehydrogenase family protein [Vicinamibacterales bacterium]
MDFEFSARTRKYLEQLHAFMDAHVLPNESVYAQQVESASSRWTVPTIMEELKAKARREGLWNLFLPEPEYGPGLTNLEYAPLCELMGKSPIASEVFNCSFPDTGNMEVLVRYGTEAQKAQWLAPLLDGTIRSAFAMTEPGVASSDATNIEASIVRDGDEYVINGRKWWTSGIGDPRCRLLIFMGKTDPGNPDRHRQQSMMLVPRDAPGITLVRMLHVFGYDDAPHGHGELTFDNVRVPAANLLLGEGRGFEIAQGRLGPGRIHHCMRQIGVAERALELMCRRARERVAFGKPLSENDVTQERIAQARIGIEQARLLVLHAAWMMDTAGNKAAQQAIAAIKVAVPEMTSRVLDWAIQLFGAAGVGQVFPLAYLAATARTMRILDGPDEVHRRHIARIELRKYQ